MDNTFEDIKDMLKANYPLLYLTTSEYGRVMQKLRRIAFELDYSFYSWDNVDGLQTHLKTQIIITKDNFQILKIILTITGIPTQNFFLEMMNC